MSTCFLLLSDALKYRCTCTHKAYLVHLDLHSNVEPSLLIFQSPWQDFAANDPAVAADRKNCQMMELYFPAYTFYSNS